MIPLKEDPLLGCDLCFSPEDNEAVNVCRQALALAGSVVITAAVNESLLAHYTRVLLSQMPGGTKSGASNLSVRRMPADKDSLLSALNRRLAKIDLETLGTKHKVPTSEVWLYELPGPSDSEFIITTATMIRQFKASGVSIIVNSRQARPGSELLQKLSQRVRGTLVEFAFPDKESCIALAEKVAGTADALQINELIRDLGHTIRRARPATVAGISQNQSESLSTQELLTKRSASDYRQPQSKTPSDFSMARYVGNRSKKSIAAAGFLTTLALVGVYAINVNDWGGVKKSAQALYADFLENPIMNLTQINDAAGDIVIQPEKVVALNEPALLKPEQPARIMAPAQKATLEDSLAQTLVDDATEQAPTKLFRVVPPRANVSEVYVQHASFGISQGAYIWKNNAKNLADTQVFVKGAQNVRFVVVSGPFKDRAEAQQYLDNAGVEEQAYFISGSVLGAPLAGPNNVLSNTE